MFCQTWTLLFATTYKALTKCNFIYFANIYLLLRQMRTTLCLCKRVGSGGIWRKRPKGGKLVIQALTFMVVTSNKCQANCDRWLKLLNAPWTHGRGSNSPLWTDFDPTPNIFCEFAAVTTHSEALLSSPSLELMKVTQYREAKTNSHIFQDLDSHSPLWQDLGSPSRHVDSTGCSTQFWPTLHLTAVRSCQLMIGKSDFLVAK